MGTVPTFDDWAAGEKVTAAKLRTNVRDGGNFFRSPPNVKVQRKAVQSLANSAVTIISHDTELWDTDAMFDPANPTFLTVQTAGLYEVKLSASPNNGVTTGLLYAYVDDGTNEIGIGSRGAWSSGAPTSVTASGDVRLAVGAKLRLAVFQTTGGAINTWNNAAGDSRFQTTLAARWVAA